jgi:hypothetical protein
MVKQNKGVLFFSHSDNYVYKNFTKCRLVNLISAWWNSDLKLCFEWENIENVIK